MREYKFRGKRVDNGEWVYGNYFIDERDIEDGFIWRDIPQIQQRYGDHYQYYDVDPSTVGQYTGLKDKNGKEIYEGDILRHKWNCGYNKWLETISIVKWHKGAFVVDDKKRADWLLSLHACADNWAEVEVIGNRWDNPELLKEVE